MIRVLFVCTGNTCRSPMAEAILKHKNLKNLEIKSAGVYAMDGSPASNNALEVLSENGMDFNHSSSLLNKELIDWATYIFTMTSAHKNIIVSQFPTSKGKTYTLKEFATSTMNGDVTDPYGGSVEVYRETYAELEALLEKMIEKLK